MRFIAQFGRNGSGAGKQVSFLIFTAQKDTWLVVAGTDSHLLGQVFYYAPYMHDEDFEDTADSLEQFLEKHIERFL